MGNCQCQAADAATVVIQHPDGRLEKTYWSLPASQVMVANPGHYVAVIITASRPRSTADHRSSGGESKPARYLKLLRPDDTLLVGHVYRLVSFEEVLREFASKRHVKLSRLLVKQKEIKSRFRNGGGGDTTSAGAQRDERGGPEAEPENSKSRSRNGRSGGDTTSAGAQRDDRGGPEAEPENSPSEVSQEEEQEVEARLDAELEEVIQGMMSNRTRAAGARHGQWRPALQSIAEVGTS